MLDAGAVVPAAVKDDDLSARRQMRDVALNIDLCLLALGWGRQGDQPEDTGAHPFDDPPDDATLAGRIASFEDDHDARARFLHPVL